MLEVNNTKYKLVYLDTNAVSDISKNYQNCLINFLKYFNFFERGECQKYALVTSVYNIFELNKTREEYKKQIITKFNLIPLLIAESFPQIIVTEINNDDFILFSIGNDIYFNNTISSIFNQMQHIINVDKTFQKNLEKDLSIWEKDRKSKKDELNLFKTSYSIYNTFNYDYKRLFNSKSAKIFSYIKYHFLYEKKSLIDSNSIIDTYNACIAPFVDVFVGERSIISWLEKSKDKYNFMQNVECIKISNFYDKN